MSVTATLIKTRALLGELGKLGIHASRATRSGHADGPDALLVADDGRVWLVVIWNGSTLQPSLLADESHPHSTLDELSQQLHVWHERLRTAAGTPAPGLMILAPALPDEELPSGLWRTAGGSVTVLSRNHCKKATPLAFAILGCLAPVLPPEAITRWRAAAVPEVRIDSPWKRKTVTRAATSLAAPLLLDYKQERCARLDLEPDPDTQPLVRDLSLRLITGVAGCGKTLVLVHRAALLATHFPSNRILLLSFNRPLINDLNRRLAGRNLGGRVECRTFYQWLAKIAPSPGVIMESHEIQRWIERERHGFPVLKAYSSPWLEDEMNWMCDHDLSNDSYLTVERKGRGTRLRLPERQEMLRLLLTFRSWMKHNQCSTWSEWALRAMENPDTLRISNTFDHLLIDEAQFFAPVWLELLRKALKPGGQLFLCADPTQGFLRRRLSWASLGLDVRSRSHVLKKPYRSTRAILQFARDFYQTRLPDDGEPLNLPAPGWLETMDAGHPPILQPGGPFQDQFTRIGAEISALLEHGTPGGDILILLAGRDFPESAFLAQLNARLGFQGAASLRDAHAPPDSIGTARLMAATGLERPIVFLLGLDELAAAECSPTLTEEEREEKYHDHTRQIYVGLTRAMERLVIYSSHRALRAAFGVTPDHAKEVPA